MPGDIQLSDSDGVFWSRPQEWRLQDFFQMVIS